jgi:pimeloyl-ACP methyl ester carboxylesterase
MTSTLPRSNPFSATARATLASMRWRMQALRLPALVLMLILGPLLTGCAAWRPTTVPIATTELPASCGARPDTLIVMLPGGGSRPEEFVSEGLVAALRERRIAADVMLVDSHIGYFRQRSIVDRLRTDVIGPARARGYRHIWIAGISLGAFGSLIYAQANPQDIAGIALLGPYLGKRELGEAIEAQGGLQRWQPPQGATDPADDDTPIWRWLQPYAERPRTTPRPELYLGYGRTDRLAFNQRLLGAALAPDHVFVADGGHDYPPWLATWRGMLDAMPLRRDTGCVTPP